MEDFDSLTVFESDSMTSALRDVHRSDDGTVWAINADDPFVYRFSPGGAVSGRTVKEGGGPGEMRAPVQIISPPAGTGGIIVWDAGRRDLVRLGEDGEPITRWTFPPAGAIRGNIDKLTHGRPFRVERIGNRLVRAVFPGGVFRPRDLRNGILVMTDSTGVVVDTLINFAAELDVPDPSDSGHALTAVPLWTVCRDSVVKVYDPYAVRVLDLSRSGREPGARRIDGAERSPVSEEHAKIYIRHRAALEVPGREVSDRDIDLAYEKQSALFGNPAPIFVDMICDDQGRVWLQHFEPMERRPLGHGGRWRVLGRKEGRASEVQLRPGLQPLEISEGEIVGVRYGSLGVNSVFVLRASSTGDGSRASGAGKR